MEEAPGINAPPPTPIATGKGKTISAINDVDLSNYLEKSLKIPELSLPKPFPCPLKPLLRSVPVGIDFKSLKSGDYTTARNLLKAAEDSGVFTINGHGFTLGDLRTVVDLVRCGNCWKYTGIDESAELSKTSYLLLRQKLESIAESVIEVIVENRKSALNPKIMKRIKEGYVILLKKHDGLDKSMNSSSVFDDKHKNTEDPCHLLSLHMSTLEMRHEFRVRCEKGYVTTFSAPVGSLLVAIGRRLEEWSNGEFKGVIGEVVLDSRHDPIPNPSFSVEFVFKSITAPDDCRGTTTVIAAGMVGVSVGLIAFLLATYFFEIENFPWVKQSWIWLDHRAH